MFGRVGRVEELVPDDGIVVEGHALGRVAIEVEVGRLGVLPPLIEGGAKLAAAKEIVEPQTEAAAVSQYGF